MHTRHQLKQASEHYKQKRASLVATEAIVFENPRTIVVVLNIMGPAANSFQGTLEGTLVSWGYIYEFFSKNALESAVFGG